MKEIIKIIQNDRILSYSSFGTLIFIILNLGSVIIFYSRLAPYIPLYNQLPWSEARLGAKAEIFIPVSIAFIIFILNAVAAKIYYYNTPLVSRLLSITNLLISFMALLLVLRTIRLIV